MIQACQRGLGWLALACLVAGCEPLVQAEKDKPSEKPAEKTVAPVKEPALKPPTHRAEKGPLKIDVTVKGVFEAAEMTEVAVSPQESWLSGPRGLLTIVKAVEHGTQVKKGEPIVWFDTDKIDQVIRDLEADRQLVELNIQQAEEELPVLEKSVPLDLASAERAKQMADEDLKRFLEKEKTFLEKTANFEVKSAANYLEYVKEELKQLEKMYRAKDLTEETEEIILKRQRDAVERMTFGLERAQVDRDLALKVTLPRRDQLLHENALKTGVALEKAKSNLPLTLSQKRVGLAKLRYDRERTTERLTKLRQDREAMTVKAPGEGVVYYGRCLRGQWTTGAQASRLQRGGAFMPDEVIVTIVKPRPYFIRGVVEEKDLHAIRPGTQGKAALISFPDLKLTAKVERVSAVPVGPGQFDVRISVEAASGAEAVMPGMACIVKFTPYKKADSLTLPTSAVFADELDEDSHYVYVPGKDGKDGKAEKRSVTVGKRAENKVEILSGLQDGDEVMQEKPTKKSDIQPKKG